MTKDNNFLAYLYLFLTVTFWAGNFVVGKFAFLTNIPPLSLVFYRWLLVWLILLPFTFKEILKFKDTISSVGEVQWSDFSITDFDLEVEFTPVYKSIQNLAEGIIVFKAPQLDIFLVADDRNNKIIYTDENLKKIKYHGDYDPNADITNPSSYLNPTLLNFLPTDLKKILDKGRELNSNYPLNYNLEELMELINDSEKLVAAPAVVCV